ncbi:MAG: hypothetical protein OER88_14560, partial [Planctomycetota bacterium]|nr:hypothetical protein [Planctomycetota bacterium]
FVLERPGIVVLEADWTGDRSLNFHLKTADHPKVRFRRAGPAPQRLAFEISEQAFASSKLWKLSFRTVGGSDAGSGRLELRLPAEGDALDPGPFGVVQTELHPTEIRLRDRKPEISPWSSARTPSQTVETWVRPRSRPLDARASDTRLRHAIEDLRSAVRDPATGGAAPDPCHWHRSLVEYLDRWHDHHLSRGTRPDSAHREYLERVVEGIDAVARLRNGRDPLIHGPVPKERSRYRAWIAVRERRLRELEFALDELRTLPYEGFAPELAVERWPSRLAACLANIERHYDLRVLEGRQAAGADLAAAEWPAMLRARSALRALTALPRRR